VAGRFTGERRSPGDHFIEHDAEVVPYAVDLAITPQDLAISNTHPAVGDSMILTANVHNAGLKATVKNAPFTVKFFDGDPATSSAILISEQRIEDLIAFNSAVPVSVPYTIQQGGLHTITVVVDADSRIPESSETNNTAQVTFGRPPAPLQLYVNAGPAQKAMSLAWTAPNTKGIDYYGIFRSTTAGKNYEFVGDTTGTDFVDTLVQPGVTYTYVVAAIDVYGARSAFSNEAVGQLSTMNDER
jgi:hypothetical protein